MRILCLICLLLVTWAQSLYANVSLPHFQYTKDSLAIVKTNIHDDNQQNPFKYVTTGVFFKKGDVKNPQRLTATNFKTEFPLQVKPHNYYDDGSLRFAVITLYVNDRKTHQDIHIVNAKSQTKKTADINISQLPDIKVHLTTAQGQKHIFDLRKAKAEKTLWNQGPLLHQQRFHTSLFKGINIDFDVTKFHTGQYHTDIIFHYNRIKKTPMKDTRYSADIYVNGKVFKTFKSMVHHHHTRWRFPINFGYKYDNSSLIDINHAMSLGIFPRLDLTMGTDLGKIEEDYHNTQQKYRSIYDAGLLTPYMPQAGGRDEIGLFPQWTSRYLVSGHDMARYVVLKHAEIASHIPWNYYDSKTHRPANSEDHPKVWIDYRASLEDNNIEPLEMSSKWDIDIAHQPSLTYVPFIISGERYHYDTMKAAYMYNRFYYPPGWPVQKTKYHSQNYAQIRGYGWFRRAAGEMHSILDINNDPDARYIQEANNADLNYLYKNLYLYENFAPKPGQKYVAGQNKNLMGELTGALEGYGHSHNNGNHSNFMQDLAAIGIGFETGLGLQPWLKQFSWWQSQFIAGRFLQKHNGYPPEMGSAYNIFQFIEDPNGYMTVQGHRTRVLNRWCDVYNYSSQKELFQDSIKEMKEKGITGYPGSSSAFTAYARASNAQLFNITRNISSIEAFGFLAQFIELAIENYVVEPSYRITPIFDDGVPLSYSNIILGSSGSNTLDNVPSYSLVHAGKGDDEIAFDRPSSKGFLFGGEGNDIINASSGSGSYLFGGDGNDTLVASSGNDNLKGDENLGTGKDRFIFPSAHIGGNLIQDFDPKRDMIKLCSQSFSSNMNIKDFLKTTKNGALLIDFSKKPHDNYSGYILLKNVRMNQISPNNVQFHNGSCH